MILLPRSLDAWGSKEFNEVLKTEIGQIDSQLLPLQQAMSRGSYAGEDNLSVMVIGTAEGVDYVRVKIGLFFTSVIVGCNCADDPTPVEEETEYCELQIDIDRATAEASIVLTPE